MHTKEWLNHRRASESQLPLRQKFSKTSISGNQSFSFTRKTPSPSTKHRLPILCGNDVDDAVSPGISSFASSSRSFSQSPVASPLSLSTRLKCFIHNGSTQISHRTSIKDGSEDDTDVPDDSGSRPLHDAMNQYLCFGIRGLPAETHKSKHRTGPGYSDLCQVEQSPNWLESPQVVSSMIWMPTPRLRQLIHQAKDLLSEASQLKLSWLHAQACQMKLTRKSIPFLKSHITIITNYKSRLQLWTNPLFIMHNLIDTKRNVNKSIFRSFPFF